MEVTLEKIELVKDRTGVSYKEAKEALEAADGSVVDAIISIEEVIDTETQKSVKEEGAAVIDKVKELVKKGKKQFHLNHLCRYSIYSTIRASLNARPRGMLNSPTITSDVFSRLRCFRLMR